MDAQSLGAMYFVAVIGILVLIVGWIILPFAIIGTKPLLRELIATQKRTNELLERAAVAGTRTTSDAAKTQSVRPPP